jgi:hypothetical protein
MPIFRPLVGGNQPFIPERIMTPVARSDIRVINALGPACLPPSLRRIYSHGHHGRAPCLLTVAPLALVGAIPYSAFFRSVLPEMVTGLLVLSKSIPSP